MATRWTYKDGMHYMQYTMLSDIPGIWHGILPRFAMDQGAAKAPFHVPGHRTDDAQDIPSSHRRLLALSRARNMVFAHQGHGAGVAVWDQSSAFDLTGPELRAAVPGDAIVTDRTETALIIRTADCQSVLIADPKRRVISNIHSGWRGSIANIVDAAIQIMASRYGCRPSDLLCGIGPSLGPCCAEFVNFRNEIPEQYWSYRRANDHFDFWQLTIDQLTAAGVPHPQIASSGVCTKCNQHVFYSYRGERQTAGRFAAVIKLNE